MATEVTREKRKAGWDLEGSKAHYAYPTLVEGLVTCVGCSTHPCCPCPHTQWETWLAVCLSTYVLILTDLPLPSKHTVGSAEFRGGATYTNRLSGGEEGVEENNILTQF